jgi:hypothetical protein
VQVAETARERKERKLLQAVVSGQALPPASLADSKSDGEGDNDDFLSDEDEQQHPREDVTSEKTDVTRAKTSATAGFDERAANTGSAADARVDGNIKVEESGDLGRKVTTGGTSVPAGVSPYCMPSSSAYGHYSRGPYVSEMESCGVSGMQQQQQAYSHQLSQHHHQQQQQQQNMNKKSSGMRQSTDDAKSDGSAALRPAVSCPSRSPLPHHPSSSLSSSSAASTSSSSHMRHQQQQPQSYPTGAASSDGTMLLDLNQTTSKFKIDSIVTSGSHGGYSSFAEMMSAYSNHPLTQQPYAGVSQPTLAGATSSAMTSALYGDVISKITQQPTYGRIAPSVGDVISEPSSCAFTCNYYGDMTGIFSSAAAAAAAAKMMTSAQATDDVTQAAMRQAIPSFSGMQRASAGPADYSSMMGAGPSPSAASSQFASLYGSRGPMPATSGWYGAGDFGSCAAAAGAAGQSRAGADGCLTLPPAAAAFKSHGATGSGTGGGSDVFKTSPTSSTSAADIMSSSSSGTALHYWRQCDRS